MYLPWSLADYEWSDEGGVILTAGFELCQTLKVWQRRIGSAKGSGTLPILAGLAKVNRPTRSLKKTQRKTHRRLRPRFRTLPNLTGLAKGDRFSKG